MKFLLVFVGIRVNGWIVEIKLMVIFLLFKVLRELIK